MPQALSPLARRILPLVDLTNVDDDCTVETARALCEKARSLPVRVAAVCLRPAFVRVARETLAGTDIKVATVINFPDAGITPEMAGSSLDASAHAALTRQAVADGADEVDLVFAWKSFIDGDRTGPLKVVEAVKAACGTARLKVILESGIYPDPVILRAACDAVIDAGADFLKTSTTRVSPAVTPEAFRVLVAASKAVGGIVGVKASGGVRTGDQAMQYVDIAADVLGMNWVTAQNFRIGASKLVDNLLEPEVSDAAIGY